MANLSDKYVFMIGGSKTVLAKKSVSRYDIENNRWEYVHELNQARISASACSLKDKIYVFGGENFTKTTGAFEFVNTIEKLNNPSLTINEASWQLIQPPFSIFYPCQESVVVPLNAN